MPMPLMNQSPQQQAMFAQMAATFAAMAGGDTSRFMAALPANPPTTNHVFGPGGLFSICGTERRVFSAMSLPNDSLAARLPVYESNLDNPIRQLITGTGTPTGSNAIEVCDDPKTVGFIYGCSTAFVFGRQSFQSPSFDVDRILLERRGDRFDMELVGGVNPTGAIIPGTTPLGNVNAGAALQNEVALGLYLLGMEFYKAYAKQLYYGNPTANTAGGGYKEFKGLDILVNTGYTDAIITETDCDPLDSYIQNFAALITTSASNTIKAFTSAWRYVRHRAKLAGLWPVKHVWAMSEMLFYELTEIWPCAYATYRCSTMFTEADSRVVDGLQLNRMRDEMRAGMFLLIDGERVEVITDPAIENTFVDADPDYFETDAYLIPLTVLNGIPVTYLESRNYNASVQLANRLAEGSPFYTTDGGKWLWVRKPVNNFCFQTLAKSEIRLILETPHLAARITNLQFIPATELPGAYPTDHLYLNEGVQARP